MGTTSGEFVIPRIGGPAHEGEAAPIMVQVYGLSDVGRTRDHNEDAFIAANLSHGEPFQFGGVLEQPSDPIGMLFMVADGMGGAAAGEIASATAVDVVLRHLREGIAGRDDLPSEQFVAELQKATEIANWSIFRYAASHPEFRGMGTTATIATLRGDTLYLAQVGDSRAYLVRDGVAYQLTKDQSLMQKLIEAGELTEEEAAQSERRNIILQALGPEQAVKVDLTHQQVRRGDVLVLCSDGLSGLVRVDAIGRAVAEEPDLQAVCTRLVAMANDLGGTDNITVVAARFEGAGLEPSASDEGVGHQRFPLGGEPTEEILVRAPRRRRAAPPAATAAPSPAGPSPAAAPPPAADPERQARGARYTRVILGLGAAVLLYALWRLLRP